MSSDDDPRTAALYEAARIVERLVVPRDIPNPMEWFVGILDASLAIRRVAEEADPGSPGAEWLPADAVGHFLSATISRARDEAVRAELAVGNLADEPELLRAKELELAILVARLETLEEVRRDLVEEDGEWNRRRKSHSPPSNR